MNLVVACGGRSPEHAVSIQSAQNIIRQADRSKYRVHAALINRTGLWTIVPVPAGMSPREMMAKLSTGAAVSPLLALQPLLADRAQTVVFPALHGPGGEDGSLQGMLESLGLPYVGCGVASSALGMDKVLMKQLMRALDIPIAPHVSLTRADYVHAEPSVIRQVEQLLSYPCFVKPARGGSSIGISRASGLDSLLQAIQTAFLHDDKILIEREIVGREIEIGLLGNEHVSCSAPGEFVREPSFFDFQCKYLDKQLAMRVPADVPPAALQCMLRYATTVFHEFGCSGLCRADFFLTAEGEVYCNEINTMPGFTEYSMYPTLWAAAGIGLPALIDRLVELAIDRQRQATSLVERSAGND